MRLVITTAVLLCCALIAKAQDEPRPGTFDPFDRWFGRISPEFERMRLDNFAIALQDNPDWVGYILVYSHGPVRQTETQRHAETQRRADRMKRYLVCYRKISWERIISIDAGTWHDASMVVLQPIPRASLSKPFFEYFAKLPKPAAVSCAQKRPGRKVRRTSRDA